MSLVTIDGSLGEGGGQVLRTTLSLSILTGKPVRLTNIRARRPRPGLMAQHLKAVEAAGVVTQALVEGAHLGSSSLTFEPRGIRSGDFSFDIGTAGSTSLVLQTILVPLSFAGRPSRVVLTGGTHVPWSPCFHYLDLEWVPLLRKIGFNTSLRLELAGFYPRGGGRVRAMIWPAESPRRLRITDRGALKKIYGISAVGNLEIGIAERMRSRTLQRLGSLCPAIKISVVEIPAASPGAFQLLLAVFEHSQCCYCGLGARGKSAERVADEAVEGLFAFLSTDGTVDPWLGDQLILPLALATGESELRTASVTRHLLTNAKVTRTFLPVRIDIEGKVGEPGSIWIRGASLSIGSGSDKGPSGEESGNTRTALPNEQE